MGSENPEFEKRQRRRLFSLSGLHFISNRREAFSLIEYQEVIGSTTTVSFIEEEKVPSDSVVVGQTWAKCNKDGSRDKRFAQNYQLPVAHYGSLSLKSQNGLWEEFQFSNPQKMVNFLSALNRFTASFQRIGEE